jgi:hypothetical protein
LLYGLEYLKEMGVMGVKVFDDSMLVVQQIKGDNQCLDGVLNNYRDRCWDVIKTLDEFSISHIPRESNWRANYLAQQASGYNVVKGMFIIKDNSTVQEGQVGDDKWAKACKKVDHDGMKNIPNTQNIDQGGTVTGEDAASGEAVMGESTIRMDWSRHKVMV